MSPAFLAMGGPAIAACAANGMRPMRYFERIDHFDVTEAVTQLDAHPELWNQRTDRTAHAVFAGTSDMWLRYRKPEELKTPADYGVPHFAMFYPPWYLLPAVKPIVYKLMADVGAVHLGGILITKIPPGGQIKPHHDRGGWHAEFYERKVYVPLRTNPKVVNHCEDESVVMGLGEAWYFNNLVTHSVVNDGETDRITLIVCMRVEE